MIWKALESKDGAEGGTNVWTVCSDPIGLVILANWADCLGATVFGPIGTHGGMVSGHCEKQDLLDSKTFQIFNHPFCRTAPSELHSAKTFLLHVAVPVPLFPSTTEVGSLPLPMGKLFFSKFFFWCGQGSSCWWLQSCSCSLHAGGSKCSSKANILFRIDGQLQNVKGKATTPKTAGYLPNYKVNGDNEWAARIGQGTSLSGESNHQYLSRLKSKTGGLANKWANNFSA